MLRRKLVLVVAVLLLLLLVTATGAVWALQHLLRQFDHPHPHAIGSLDEAALIDKFRWLVLVLAIIFVLVINVTAVVLLRTAGLILRPVEALVEGTRLLGDEHFDHRVQIDQNDEFGELARAFNQLAERLGANEQRKLETLKQVALALNHELNNAAAIIELQLQLLSRRAGDCPRVENCAWQIHQGLRRMSQTLDSLNRVRRIVLTDYVSGVKMLDLRRSVLDNDEQAEEHDFSRRA